MKLLEDKVESLTLLVVLNKLEELEILIGTQLLTTNVNKKANIVKIFLFIKLHP